MNGWSYSSAGEHFLDVEGVAGSIPANFTITKIKSDFYNKFVIIALFKKTFIHKCILNTPIVKHLIVFKCFRFFELNI